MLATDQAGRAAGRRESCLERHAEAGDSPVAPVSLWSTHAAWLLESGCLGLQPKDWEVYLSQG